MFLVADNLQALNPLIARALDELDPAPIEEMARFCRKAGARYLDLNPGYLSRRREDRMTFLVETVQEATDLDLVLDSPNPRLLARGLAACQKKPIINALTREPSKIAEILPLAVEHRTSLVILLIDENSMVPRGLDEKMALALEMREICLAAGLSHQQLIFDPVLPSLGQPDAFHQVGQVMETLRLLSSGALFQDQAATMLGLSNLRTGHKKIYPVEVEKICLALAVGAGLKYALADLRQEEITAAARAMERFN